MLLCPNELSEKDIQTLKKYWDDTQDKVYVNWIQDGKVLDRRLIVKEDSEAFDIVERIVKKYFKEYAVIWGGYQRQNFAHQIHIDDYGEEFAGMYRYTFIFSFLTEPRFKTIVWKETAWNNAALHELVTKWGKQRKILKKKSNISTVEDLEHTFDTNQQDYLSDYLELDGVYTYQEGSGLLFDATQLHCTSNWIKYEDIPYRELLQIHVVTKEKLEL
jgi:hypothetical protein